MNRSKVEFIIDILQDKKLSPFHRERLYPLILTEIRQVANVDENILKEIEEIKRLILPKHENDDDQSEEIPSHNPIQTSDALKLFKIGNNLKWIAHIYPNSGEDTFNYKRITENAIIEFNSISRTLPKKLAALISVFLKPPKDLTKGSIWYLGKPYKTWWSDEIKTWCRANPGLHPDTNEALSLSIITPFKKSVEIRHRDDLIEAMKFFLPHNHGHDIFEKIEVDFTKLKKSTRFFTGVDQLLSGISCLFAPILKRTNVSHKVRVSSSISELNDRYVTVVSISHVGSHCNNEFDGENLINGDLLTAKGKFISLCDWNIVANFSNGTFCIPVLGSTEGGMQQERAEGFTHQLIFY